MCSYSVTQQRATYIRRHGAAERSKHGLSLPHRQEYQRPVRFFYARSAVQRYLINKKIGCFVIAFITCLNIFVLQIIQYINTPPPNFAQVELEEALSTQVADGALRFLCTTDDKRYTWGSYELRCKHFKKIVQKFYPEIAAVDTLPFSKLDKIKNITYDATILVKTIDFEAEERFGHIFVDVIDEYGIHDKKDIIPNNWTVIVQNSLQDAVFPHHKSLIVPHWFNSFSTDWEPELPPSDEIFGNNTLFKEEKKLFYFDTSNLHSPGNIFKTAMFLSREKCDVKWGKLPKNIKFDCNVEKWDISRWYRKYVDISAEVSELIIQEFGNGYLYRMVYHRYDAVVVPPKSDENKMQYNSMQRAVSQMRSGVPVILGCYGGAHLEFCHQHKYSCTYSETKGSFETVVKRMKDSPELRKQCQMEGYEISKLYAPKEIVGEYLQKITQTIHEKETRIANSVVDDLS